MLFSIAADERAALQFDDLASALDAGLPLQAMGADAARGDRAIHDALRGRGVVLSPTEGDVLAAAWKSGRIGEALRQRAEDRRQRAELARKIWAGVRYPAVLILMLLVASVVTAPVIGHWWFLVGLLAGLLVAALFVAAAFRGLKAGDERWLRVPILGHIAAELAELPYLETLQAMYAAGIPLLQSHERAVAAVPLLAVRNRLQIADRILHEGRPLAEALAAALALHAETRTLLATGEHAGNLEDALQRALSRRRDATARSLADTVRRGSAVLYVVVGAVVAAIIISFYTSLFAGLRSHR